MTITREQAIKVLDLAIDEEIYHKAKGSKLINFHWIVALRESGTNGLYSFSEVLKALGVTQEEIDNALGDKQ